MAGRYKPGDAPRSPQMPGTRTVSRCAQCGTLLRALVDQVVIDQSAQCPQCGFALHSCKQCTHFDPGSRFECRQPIAQRVAQKDANNACEFYAVRVTLEKETSVSAARPEDARAAFERLFKK